MTPSDFAALLDRAYKDMRPWSEADIQRCLQQPSAYFLSRDNAGLIAQIAGGEAEILVLATDPDAQRTGQASALMEDLARTAKEKDAGRIVLEVAEQNAAARAFYAAQGFAEVGRRKAYYTLRDGSKDDALLLSRPVP